MKSELVDFDRICCFYLKAKDEDSSDSPITRLKQERAERVARDAKIRELLLCFRKADISSVMNSVGFKEWLKTRTKTELDLANCYDLVAEYGLSLLE